MVYFWGVIVLLGLAYVGWVCVCELHALSIAQWGAGCQTTAVSVRSVELVAAGKTDGATASQDEGVIADGAGHVRRTPREMFRATHQRRMTLH